MAIELSYNLHTDYLEVRLKGTRSPQLEYEESQILWKRIFGLCMKYGHKKVLVQLDIRGRIPMRARIHYAFTMEEMGWQKQYKVAGVTLNDQVDNDVRIVERFANKVGYEVKVFSNKVVAMDWLLNNQIELETRII